MRTKETAAATIAPAKIGLQCRYVGRPMAGSVSIKLRPALRSRFAAPSAKSQEGENEHDDDDQTNEINQTIHRRLHASSANGNGTLWPANRFLLVLVLSHYRRVTFGAYRTNSRVDEHSRLFYCELALATPLVRTTPRRKTFARRPTRPGRRSPRGRYEGGQALQPGELEVGRAGTLRPL